MNWSVLCRGLIGVYVADVGQGLTLDKLEANSTILLIGGSETTATLLSGVTFLLVTNPKALARLADEVRSSFASEDEIDINSVGRLTYMMACLNETLRMYPPVPAGLPRVVPKSGRRIVGHVIPKDVSNRQSFPSTLSPPPIYSLYSHLGT